MIRTVFTVIVMLIVTYSVAQDKFEIYGKLSRVKNGKKVMLSYVDSEGKNVRDSTMLKNGKFHFKGTTAFGNKATLALVPLEKDDIRKNIAIDFQQFYLEKGKYKVIAADSLKFAAITGTKVQDEFNSYNVHTKDLLDQFKDITARFSKVYYAKVKDTLAIQAIQAEARPVYARIESVLDSFIFSNPDSYVALDLILENKTVVIDPAVFSKYYDPLSERVLASFNGQKLTQRYNKAKRIAIGQAVDFEMPDKDGNTFKLSSLKGKYVLVDFWASWCVPCRAENPHLLKAYKELNSKGFEIVGVSLDDNREAWLRAVEYDNLPWIQLGDLKGFNSDVAVKYGISAIPQNFLIDPEGKVIGKDLRGENVSQMIASLMDK